MRYTNKFNVPKSLCRALMADDYDLSKVDKKLRIYSATGLIRPVRQSELQRRHWDELTQDVSDNLWKLMGSSIHSVLENAGADDIIGEQRLFLDMETGEVFKDVSEFKDLSHTYVATKPDIYDIPEETIEDFKVTSVWSIVFMNSSGGGKQEWTEQLNIYSYVMRKAKYPVKALKVIAILRDWQKSKAQESFDYPQLPFQVIDIPLWDDAKTYKFIKEKVDARILCEKVGDDNLPICTPEERWSKGTVYAIMAKGKKKSLKLCRTQADADTWVKTFNERTDFKEYPKSMSVSITVRAGEDVKCKNYCGVGDLCSYYREKYSDVIKEE